MRIDFPYRADLMLTFEDGTNTDWRDEALRFIRSLDGEKRVAWIRCYEPEQKILVHVINENVAQGYEEHMVQWDEDGRSFLRMIL